MAAQIRAHQFHEASGVDDWRVLSNGAHASFRTGSFAAGVEFIEAIGELADAANHHPDVDIRYGSVSVRLWTHDVNGLSDRDIALAQRISAAARELDIPADPLAIQHVSVALDAAASTEIKPFWRAVLGYVEHDSDELTDPRGRGPSFQFRTVETPPHSKRIHIEVSLPPDEAPTRVAAAIAAGGDLVSDQDAPSRWVLADSAGNEASITTWMDRS